MLWCGNKPDLKEWVIPVAHLPGVVIMAANLLPVFL